MNIAKISRHSWFADLAYVRWEAADIADPPTDTNPSNLASASNGEGRLPARSPQNDADTLADNIFVAPPHGLGWQLLNFAPNDDDTGFAAALFGNPSSGETILAIRGTELGDFDRDLLQADLQEIGGLGMAVSQTVSMFNYIRRLQAPLGNPVFQLSLQRAALAPPGVENVVTGDDGVFWVEAEPSGVGLGLLAPGAAVSVTGHSLGGHLAALALRLFPAQFDAAVTFNAPGYDALLGANDTEAMIAALAGVGGAGTLAAIGQVIAAITQNGQMLTDAFVDTLFEPHLPLGAAAGGFIDLAAAGRIVSLVAEDQTPGDDRDLVSSLLSGIPAGAAQPLTVEVNSHGMGGMVDALSVMALLERIEPGIGLDRAGHLIALGSARAEDAQERLLNSLSRLFLEREPAPLPLAVPAGITQIFSGPQPFANRGVLHTRILALEAAIGSEAGFTLHALDGYSTAELVALAAGEIGYRYALSDLNSYAITGNDVIYNDLAGLDDAAWSSDYWTDRARFVAGLSAARSNDHVSYDGRLVVLGETNVDFYDAAIEAELAEVKAGLLPNSLNDAVIDTLRGGDGPPAQVVFGVEAMVGSAGGDRLYGTTGNDTLSGGAGRVYLEGGVGHDLLYGTQAGVPDDVVGDRLAGGSGLVVYVVGHGDVISDSDRQAEIRFALDPGAQPLLLSTTYHRVADHVYRNAELNVTLYLQDSAASIVAFGLEKPGVVRIEGFLDPLVGFVNGDFGIVLEGAPAPEVPGPHRVIGGDANDRLDSLGALVGSDGDDVIEGLGGDDDLFGGRGFAPWGRDRLLGGAGNDYLDSSTPLDLGTLHQSAVDPGDLFDGGAGDDVAVGNGGDDQQYGGVGRDFLSGRDGADLLHGGPDDDVLAGGGGDDLLLGGAGNDYLFSAFDVWATPARDWHASLLADPAGRVIDIGLGGVIIGPNPPPADNDIAYGGNGDDFINGGNGDDELYGEAGDDVVFGWRGSDRLDGGTGDDTLYGDTFGLVAPGEEGDDELSGGAGDDELFGEAGDDRLYGGSGNDLLRGGDGNDFLVGGAGNDGLIGGKGDDSLVGGDGDDVLDGGDGGDVLSGNEGNDALFGGPGHDAYLWGPGDGHDVVSDSGGYDTVVIRGVATLDEFSVVDNGEQLIVALDEHNSLTLNGWADGAIERLIVGASVLVADRGDTPNVLHEAAADDTLYTFSPADGDTRFDDRQGRDTLVFGTAVRPQDIDATVAADGTWRSVIAGATLEITDWRDTALTRFVFADGSDLDHAQLDAGSAHAPRLAVPLTDASAVAGTRFEYRLHPETFSDADGDALSYSIIHPAGGALPSWLSFSPATATFSGVAPAADVGRSFEIRLRATDATALHVEDDFFIDVFPAFEPAAPVAYTSLRDIDGANGFITAGIAPFVDDPFSEDVRADFLQSVGDLNNDGFDDLIRYTAPALYAVADEVSIIFGRAGGFGPVLADLELNGLNGTALTGAGWFDANIAFGDAPGHAPIRGDFNGDGIDDVALPAGFGGADGPRIILGRGGAFAPSLDYAALPRFAAEPPDNALTEGFFPTIELVPGLSPASAGDVNGDGIEDRLYSRGSTPNGGVDFAAVVVYGAPQPVEGELRIETLDGSQGFILLPPAFAGGLGSTVHALGDVNGDGFGDIGLGSTTVSFDGVEDLAAVVYGKPSGYGGALDLAGLDGSNGYFAALPIGLGTPYTSTARPAGDINGDGLADVIMSSTWADASYLVYGARNDTVPLSLGTPGVDVLHLNFPFKLFTGGGDDRIDIEFNQRGQFALNSGSGRDTIRFGSTLGPRNAGGVAPIDAHLSGGAGQDLYIAEGVTGNVIVHISDPSAPIPFGAPGYEGNRLKLIGTELGQNVRSRARLGLGSLVLSFGDDIAEFHLESFDPGNVFGGPRDLDSVEFEDGVVMRYEDIIALGFDLDGSSDDDHIEGTEVVDRIRAYAGHDVLRGGAGDDLLDGGAGDDTYLVGRGDGNDRIEDSAGADTVRWGAGITLADLALVGDGQDLRVEISDTQTLTLASWFDNPTTAIETFEFFGGATVTVGSLLNRAPVLVTPLLDQRATEGEVFHFVLPVGTFADPDTDDVLSLSAQLADGSSLPDWLGFDAPTGTFHGIARDTDIRDLSITVTAVDSAGQAATDQFRIAVDPIWHAFLGTTGADVIVTTASRDRVLGDSGDDLITTGDGDDLIYAHDGNDSIFAGAGDDTIYAANGNDVVDAGGGNNIVYGGYHDDRISAGGGDDFIDAGYGHDTVDAGAGTNTLFGGAGDDTLRSGAGADTIDASDGADFIDAGAGDDVISGGNGNDVIHAGSGNNTIYGGYHNDTITALDGDDTIDGYYGADWIDAGDGNNSVSGGEGDDVILTGSGSDRVMAGAGDDRIDSGAGQDFVYAEQGDDVIAVGAGDKRLYGGSGSDRYEISARQGAIRIDDSGGASDELVFVDPDIVAEDLWFSRFDTDLGITAQGSGAALIVADWFAYGADSIETVGVADGRTLGRDGVAQLVQAMAAFAPGAGPTASPPSVDIDALEPVIAAAWAAA